ncbi:MAG: holin [Micrococcales bacterium]|nr:holin [Micrococcales bacterium]
MLTKPKFWQDLAERSISTFAETLGAVLAAAGIGIMSGGFAGALATAGFATFIAALKAFVKPAVVDDTEA